MSRSPDFQRLIETAPLYDIVFAGETSLPSPTLDSWKTAETIQADYNQTLTSFALAYSAAVESAMRPATPGRAHDLPIGAAIYDAKSGLYVTGYARDQETGEREEAHAETNTIRAANEVFDDLFGKTITATVEECPTCLVGIAKAGLGRAGYSAARSDLEEMKFVKFHEDKAEDIITRARQEDPESYPFDLFRMPLWPIRAACLELFTAYMRNPQTEKVEKTNLDVSGTRFHTFSHMVNFPEQYWPKVPDAEIDVIRGAFAVVLKGFSGAEI